MSNVTPQNNLEIELIVKAHIYCDFKPVQSEAHSFAIERLERAGMIQRTSGGGYTTSLKGQFWMDHIRTIPYPVEVMRFAIPEQEREDR